MVRVYRIALPSSDIERDVRFFQEILSIDGSRASPGRHYFDCGGTIISCYDAAANGDVKRPRANDEYIYFAVDDIDATYARARKAGAPLDFTPLPNIGALGEVLTRPWGERSFYTCDPSGNPLCFTAADTVFTSGTLPS